MREVADRTDGKPAQQLIHSGDADLPIRYAEISMTCADSESWLEPIGEAMMERTDLRLPDQAVRQKPKQISDCMRNTFLSMLARLN